MDCERFDKNSMDLLYGELDELSEAATLRHLHHCTRCREIWGHLRTTRELSQLPFENPPDDLAARIIDAEKVAHRSLPARERFSRTISVLAGYAMRPQLAMAALLVLMVGSGLIFVRAQPTGKNSDDMRVVERGAPSVEAVDLHHRSQPMVFGGDPDPQKPAVADEDRADQDEAEDESESRVSRERNREKQRAAYADAMTAYQQGRYAEAERLFSEVASAGGEQAASAALHEGHAARNGSGCQRAAAIYDEVAARAGGGTIAHEAAWHAASCYRAMGQVARALGHYKKLAAEGAFAERAQQAMAELSPVATSGESSSKNAALGEEAAQVKAEPGGPNTPQGDLRREPSAAAKQNDPSEPRAPAASP